MPGAVTTTWIVARRELRERLRTRGFRAGTALMALVAVLAAALPALAPDLGREKWTIAVRGDAPRGLEKAIDAATDARVTLRRAPPGEPRRLVGGDRDIDAVLVDASELVVDGGAPDDLAPAVTAAVARLRLADLLARRGLDQRSLRAATEVRVTTAGKSSRDREGEAAIGFFGVLILFVAIVTYGNWVLTSVLEEKANRIVEVIVAAVAPRHLLAGKVLGTGAAGLLQLVAVLAAGLAAAAAVGALPDLPVSGIGMALAMLAWFVLGFTFYAVGYAAAGSLVARQEDAQSAATPMVTLVIVAYFLAAAVVNSDPGATSSAILSVLPPVAPLAMPGRMAAGEASAAEVAAAAVLLVGATLAMVAVAARIYTNAILRTGARVRLREAVRR